ncbi:hypothetical protein LCI18_012067 [Fusarium solani-melongenae]|uniref:Uncharacterized protein n=1 Tax=Fusarium solani subsp. cucurbitae TaxID=2747967 RepID=A0ACD3ZIS0_FUSSC|nr:hypothetical protein LCI18_012067 [Fusarium solani-melongenae]
MPPPPHRRPPSDQELIDSFTDRELEFYNWHEETRATRAQLDLLGGVHFIKDKWSNPDDLNDYFEWTSKWSRRHRDRWLYQWTDQEIFEQLRNTNFASRDDLARHCWAMEMSNNPLAFLGSARRRGNLTGYGFQPSSTFLWPTQDRTQKDYSGKTELMHESLLAINLEVPVQMTGLPSLSTTTRPTDRAIRYRHGQMTPDSTQSDPDQTPTSFVFAQLGELYVFVGDWEAALDKSDNCDEYCDHDDDCNDDDDDDVDGTWERTGFGVVVEVQSNGKPKGLWAIYSCLPPRDDLLEDAGDDIDKDLDTLRIHRQNEQDDSFIFNDPEIQGNENPCYVIKMTDDLHGLGLSKELDLQVVCRREVQIGRARSQEKDNGRLVVFPELVADK